MLGLELTLFNDILRFDYVLDSILCFWNGYFDIQMRTFSRPPNSPPPTVTVSNDVHDIDSDFGEGAKKNPFNYISG